MIASLRRRRACRRSGASPPGTCRSAGRTARGPSRTRPTCRAPTRRATRRFRTPRPAIDERSDRVRTAEPDGRRVTIERAASRARACDPSPARPQVAQHCRDRRRTWQAHRHPLPRRPRWRLTARTARDRLARSASSAHRSLRRDRIRRAAPADTPDRVAPTSGARRRHDGLRRARRRRARSARTAPAPRAGRPPRRAPPPRPSPRPSPPRPRAPRPRAQPCSTIAAQSAVEATARLDRRPDARVGEASPSSSSRAPSRSASWSSDRSKSIGPEPIGRSLGGRKAGRLEAATASPLR